MGKKMLYLGQFDADLVARLDAEAEARMVSRAWLVGRLVRDGLDRLPPLPEHLRGGA